MKLWIILFIILISFSCKRKENVYYYPNFKQFQELKNRDTLLLDNFKSFNQLIDSLSYYKWKTSKSPIILIKDDINHFYLKSRNFENDCFQINTIQRKNQIGVSKDSIMKNGIMHSISKLDFFLKKDLFNNNKDDKYARKHNQLVISFLDTEETIEELKSNLLNIFKIYNKINLKDTLELNIELNKMFIPLPPPPLPMDLRN